ncbi:MAG: hypothetical protein ACXWFO_09725, partial [Candidatus Aminicenantales bacterium]
KMLGRDLPADLVLPRGYDGPPRVILPAVRTSVESGEPLALKVLVLAKSEPASVELFWRNMGPGAFRAIPLEHKTRGVYAVTLPAPADAIEYYVEVKAGGETARFPVTAPALCQSVIVLPEAR